MTTLLEVLPRNEEGQIITPVGGYDSEGNALEGMVSPTWFQNNFSTLASANVPLSETDFAALKTIGDTWADSAEIWRGEGLI